MNANILISTLVIQLFTRFTSWEY